MKKDRDIRAGLTAWLKAEAAGDAAAAETAFSAVVGALPRLAPSPGFAERVAWAVAPAAREAVPAWVVRLARGGLAVALTLVALTVGLLPALGRLSVGLPGPGDFARGVAAAIGWAGGQFEAGLALWRALGRIGEATSLVLTTPEAQAALAGSAILAMIGFYALHHLLTFERSVVR